MILLYSSISMVQVLKKTQRDTYRNFISDPNYFYTQRFIDPNDDSFGLQPQVKMLAYAGIETKSIGEFVPGPVAKKKKKKKTKKI